MISRINIVKLGNLLHKYKTVGCFLRYFQYDYFYQFPIECEACKASRSKNARDLYRIVLSVERPLGCMELTIE
ncbi:unnamed protein product, partial [Iphiclides podalirius]